MSYARGFENPNPSKQGGLKSEERRAMEASRVEKVVPGQKLTAQE